MSNSAPFGPSPREAIVARDRQLATLYVERGKPKNGVSSLARDLGVARKVLERAIARQLEWAEARVQESEGPSAG